MRRKSVRIVKEVRTKRFVWKKGGSEDKEGGRRAEVRINGINERRNFIRLSS